MHRNACVKTHGAGAEPFCQWEMTGSTGGKPAGFQGHTTPIFECRAACRLLVPNHNLLDVTGPAAALVHTTTHVPALQRKTAISLGFQRS